MSKKVCWLVIIICVVADVFIMVRAHNWCAGMSRDTILWMHGAVEAYSQAYFLGLVMCVMCSIPALLAVLDLTYKPKK